MKRKRRKNPSSWGEFGGGAAAIAVPIAVGALAMSVGGPGLGVLATRGTTFTGLAVGAGFAFLNGIGKPSFSRGYAVASLGTVVAGLALGLALKAAPADTSKIETAV